MTEKLEEDLARIGQLMLEAMGGEPNGIFLHAEVDDNTVQAMLFRDEGQVVTVRHGGWYLGQYLFDMWNRAPSGKKFYTLEYTITGDSFEADFGYDKPEDDDDDDNDVVSSLDSAIARRFGDKPYDNSHPEAVNEPDWGRDDWNL